MMPASIATSISHPPLGSSISAIRTDKPTLTRSLFSGFRRKSSTASLDIVHATHLESKARNPKRKPSLCPPQLPSPQSSVASTGWPSESDLIWTSTHNSTDGKTLVSPTTSSSSVSETLVTIPSSPLSAFSAHSSCLSPESMMSYDSDILPSDTQQASDEALIDDHKRSVFRFPMIRLPKMPRRNSNKPGEKEGMIISGPFPISHMDSIPPASIEADDSVKRNKEYTYSLVMDDLLYSPSVQESGSSASSSRVSIHGLIYDDIQELECVQEEATPTFEEQECRQEPTPPSSPTNFLSRFRDSARQSNITFDDLMDRMDDSFGRRSSQTASFDSREEAASSSNSKTLPRCNVDKPAPLCSFPVELSPLSGQEDTIGRPATLVLLPAAPLRPAKSIRRQLIDKPTLKPAKLSSFKIDLNGLDEAPLPTFDLLKEQVPPSAESWRSEFQDLIRWNESDDDLNEENAEATLVRPQPTRAADERSPILKEACALAEEYRKSLRDDWRSIYSSISGNDIRQSDVPSFTLPSQTCLPIGNLLRSNMQSCSSFPLSNASSDHIFAEDAPSRSSSPCPEDSLTKLMPLSTITRSLRSAIPSALLADDSLNRLARDLNAFMLEETVSC